MLTNSLERKSIKISFLIVLLAHILIIGLFCYTQSNVYVMHHTLKASLQSKVLSVSNDTFLSNASKKSKTKTDESAPIPSTAAITTGSKTDESKNIPVTASVTNGAGNLTSSSSGNSSGTSIPGAANPKPYYPKLSRQLGEEGVVYLRVVINPNGDVQQVTINKSSGFKRLDISALQTVKKWRFITNATQRHTIIQPIYFSLKE